MTVIPTGISALDSMFVVRDWISVTGKVLFAFVRFLERRDKHYGLRYDDRTFDCKGSGEAGDVGDQWLVSPDSTSVLMQTHRAWPKTWQ